MPDKTTKPVIFISYSHKDEPNKLAPDEVPWLTFVQSFLAPVVKTGIFDIWVDQHLHGSDGLEPEIKVKLNACDIFVLLASRHSLASTYIVETEIATMRRRMSDGDDVRIFPIILSPIPNAALKQLKDLVLKPKDGQPLSLMLKNDREIAMAGIADDIAVVAEAIANRKASRKAKTQKSKGPARTLDALPTELVRAIEGIVVDTEHLPETAYERLVGRNNELKRLDAAWADTKTNIISLVAEGGAGKSALVNEWLKDLQTDNYRGAAVVLGWSFYSQGTKERSTSADEFLNWALTKLNITSVLISASAKAEAIAEVLMKRRVLLMLDGVEPLQHGPGPQLGQLKDLALRALLRRFAATPPTQVHGLVVLTSRLAIEDISRWHDRAAPVIAIERLSDEAGAAVLRDNGVWGIDKEMKAAAHDFGGHALALALLASFIKETQAGDVRRRDHIRAYLGDSDSPRHDHARRVMESYEKEWLDGQPVLLAIMHMVGLFDRPASRRCLFALRKFPIIDGLTNAVVDVGDKNWQRAIIRLREVRLLSPPDKSAPDELDAHPLIREWFGERFRKNNNTAWKAAHSRLYEHLRDTTKEGKTPTLEDLGPLYQAIAHGCCAGRYEETLENVYVDRICQRWSDGDIVFYALEKLGAVTSDLAAIWWFFDKPFEELAFDTNARNEAIILGAAASCLQSQGRLTEALPAFQAALRLLGAADQFTSAATCAANMGNIQQLLGEITSAIDSATLAIKYADRGTSVWQKSGTRTARAYFLYLAGNLVESELQFAEAERLHPSKLLSFRDGFCYCQLLLQKGRFSEVYKRVNRTIVTARKAEWPLQVGLDTLTQGKVHHALALQDSANAQETTSLAREEFLACIAMLNSANEFEAIVLANLARAAFRRSVGDWNGVRLDLAEVEEIAELGSMRLFLCDTAIERSRLAFAQIEAFAPLNGLIDNSPPKPEQLDQAKRNSLLDEAAKQLTIAAEYIDQCRYHRRDEELAELRAVLRGDKTFAELPPRV